MNKNEGGRQQGARQDGKVGGSWGGVRRVGGEARKERRDKSGRLGEGKAGVKRKDRELGVMWEVRSGGRVGGEVRSGRGERDGSREKGMSGRGVKSCGGKKEV